MKVRRIARSFQVVVKEPEDMAAVKDLDEALWAAMSAPRESFRAPSEFLQAVDKDNNGRITSGEIKEAVRYLFDHLRDTSRVCEAVHMCLWQRSKRKAPTAES